MAAYATKADLYKHGLPRGLLTDQHRAVTSVDAAANTFTVGDHGLSLNTPVRFVAEPGNGTLPAGLTEGTTYYAIATTDSVFQVAATEGGAAIDVTDAGSGVFGFVVPVDEEINETLELYSRVIDRKTIAHAIEFTAPYPVEVVHYVAKLSARELLQRRGRQSEAVNEAAARVEREFRDFVKGIPLRTDKATASTNSAVHWGNTRRSWDTPGDSAL